MTPTAELKPLTPEQREVIEKNVGLIGKVAKSRSFVGMEYDDLFQEGVIAFAGCFRTFREERGIKISTYASWAVRSRLLDVKASSDLIRVPRSAQYSEHSPNRNTPFTRQATSIRSIHYCDGATMELLEEEEEEPDPATLEKFEAVREAMKKLTRTERAVIVGTAFRGETHRRVGERLGMSPHMVQYHRSKAMKKLRVELAAYA